MSKDYTKERIVVPRFNEESGFYTTPQRSKIMSKIRGKNTKPEMAFRKALFAVGYRYRIDYKKLIGKPDIALNKYKTVIFIDGEYWHGYNWEERKPKIKTNREFWVAKIERNIQRDQEVNAKLKEMGYTIFRFWESEIKKDLERCLTKVTDHLKCVETQLRQQPKKL
ncbi:very short patch repair endonuclease [Maribacter sp. MMG018]|uniref:very short patch repair endonuclease n=1 Tax=Maribacter sp. MMG018 TaxID=2822688 RepID=UPI001B382E59|nr:very short patch repair endonuclease [Maribacter sp. MMG018]MBQ4913485.1 very short patch repair endonuclease [Maribacter sp. MMG018]